MSTKTKSKSSKTKSQSKPTLENVDTSIAETNTNTKIKSSTTKKSKKSVLPVLPILPNQEPHTLNDLELGEEYPNMSVAEKRRLADDIERLDDMENIHIEIYKLLRKEAGRGMVKNSYGVFIDLKDISDATLWKLRKRLNYWADSLSLMKKEETTRKKMQQKMFKKQGGLPEVNNESDHIKYVSGVPVSTAEFEQLSPTPSLQSDSESEDMPNQSNQK